MRPPLLPSGPARERADRLLVERGIFDSRSKAKAAIEAGLVRADGSLVRKASEMLPSEALIAAEAPHPFVSRGGVKLSAALDAFGFDPGDQTCLDVGASTGGFTDVLLQRGARHVYAVDVGHSQLHPSLAADRRVTSLEGTDARELDSTIIPELIDGLVADVSFISLKLVLPAAAAFLRERAWLVTLVKPQFEAGPAHVRKGIVRDASIHQTVCNDIAAFVAALGFEIVGLVPSPIAGQEGNQEFLLGARHG
jgi:23S rRNA (cytidine1920-2'-O)/16S rRNA (cytidine1409-2'-O)-methyltransferase